MSTVMWGQADIQKQLQIINGQLAPDILIRNADYLHSIYKKWMRGNVWIAGDRIVYVGEEMPALTDGTEIIDAEGKKIVPGYIEPHVHPFQLYNPVSFAEFASQGGTTTFLSDSLTFFLVLENEQSFNMLDQMNQLPFAFYWWARFDSQTVLKKEAELFNPKKVTEWLKRPDVLMGGELTGWPRLLAGDPTMLSSLVAAKALGVKVEGHFPGASERTLARMKLLGTDGDHEAMTIDEVESRLLHGYGVTLRQSSIRQDLPQLLKDVVERELNVFDHLMMTTDGSTPSFYDDGVMDKCIRIALQAGVAPIDAYQMATYNIARYYDIADVHGILATGRYATLNILENELEPTPTDVLSKGKWLKRNGQTTKAIGEIDWSSIPTYNPAFELSASDFTFTQTVGIEMVNDVITKPYKIEIDVEVDRLAEDHDESFLMLVDRDGKWRVNTLIKGFATNVQGFASSYSNTGDVILLGKDKQEMLNAFNEIKRIGGGMVVFEQGQAIATLPLSIGGVLSEKPVAQLIEKELELKKALSERGYQFGDVIYTFLFLQSTHLPYVRITQLGLFDVMKNEVLIPAVER